MRVTIPGELPAMNEIIAAAKRSRYAYNDEKQAYTTLVATEARLQGVVRFERADIHCHWVCKNRRKDKDNVQAGIKFVLDGLVQAGVLPNDGWRNIGTITHSFAVDKDRPRVEITVTQAKEAAV
jgi:Holliday junction resolvase RusA-like endonuclease